MTVQLAAAVADSLAAIRDAERLLREYPDAPVARGSFCAGFAGAVGRSHFSMAAHSCCARVTAQRSGTNKRE